MCIRALDYCPPVNLEFGDYLRAIITADRDLIRDDNSGYRVAFIDAFREREISRTMSVVLRRTVSSGSRRRWKRRSWSCSPRLFPSSTSPGASRSSGGAHSTFRGKTARYCRNGSRSRTTRSSGCCGRNPRNSRSPRRNGRARSASRPSQVRFARSRRIPSACAGAPRPTAPRSRRS